MLFFLFLLYLLLFILILTAMLAAAVFIYVATNMFFIAFVTKVPPIQTDKKYFSRILSRLTINPQTVIYDLGCGGGNFLIAASKFNPKQCLGYELSFWPYLSAKWKAWLSGGGRVKIFWADFFKVDLKEADIVYVYLLPTLLSQIEKKLEKELKAGSWVLIKGQPLPNRKYNDKIVLDDKSDYGVYIYKF